MRDVELWGFFTKKEGEVTAEDVHRLLEMCWEQGFMFHGETTEYEDRDATRRHFMEFKEEKEILTEHQRNQVKLASLKTEVLDIENMVKEMLENPIIEKHHPEEFTNIPLIMDLHHKEYIENVDPENPTEEEVEDTLAAWSQYRGQLTIAYAVLRRSIETAEEIKEEANNNE